MFAINCSRCNEQIKLPDDALGKTINCPKCKTLILIPDKPLKSTGELSTFLGGAKTKPLQDEE
jgi:DNA-directed RNA polymerase subunit RPC12/RpoP